MTQYSEGEDVAYTIARDLEAFEAAEQEDEQDDGVYLSNSHEWSARYSEW